MLRSRLWLLCTWISLTAHVVLAAFLGVQALWHKQPPPKPKRVVRVRLLPHVPAAPAQDKLLPRKPSATAGPSSPKSPVRSAKRAAHPAAKQATTGHKRNKQAKSSSYQQALSRLDAVVGSQSQAAKAYQQQLADQLNQELKQDYAQRVQSLIQSAYRLPNVLSAFEKAHLRVVLLVSIGPQGHLLDVNVKTPSGNAIFDQAVVEGTKQVASFGPPPRHQVDYYRTQGMVVEFCPTACPSP